VVAIALGIFPFLDAALAEDIATCGKSHGYGFYPKVGLGALSDDSGKWVEDGISSGKFTLTRIGGKEFDIHVTDASGRIFSSKQDGAHVIVSGPAKGAVSAVVIYPSSTVTETCTFYRNEDGKAKAMWTANKGGGAPVMKVTAFIADCSFFAF